MHMQRTIEIPLPKFVRDSARAVIRSRAFQALGWNVPILLAVFGFLLGFQSLRDRELFEGMGFQWAVINEKTLRAESLMLWTAAHLLVPIVFAVLYNGVYLLRPASLLGRCVRRSTLLAASAFCFWFFEQGFYLARKLVSL
jgi:hypothetical protein